ncbi:MULTISPECIES: flagellar hook-associated protein FlgL [unclassified Salinibacterium]|uniref:flagellar hook-associated protein FlgL n=1 Tax=unclassified Salinibacterium TaxID=2632331 RepID=UPI00142441A7|nr:MULTISPECIES: flagellar hook-associated protein FlgL [unclassified Salinibacterium]
MITRTTTNMMMQNAQRNLQTNMAALARLQEQASSQKAITRPSDDPTATADSLRIRAEQRATEQYGRNIDDGTGWLTTIDSALGTTTTLMNRVRDLAVQGANDGAMSPTAKQAIVTELEGLKAELLNVANTKYQGRSVFAGNSDAATAFDAASYAYAATGATVERRISAHSTIRVDADGAATFGAGPGSVFALVDQIAAELTGGTNIGPQLGAIDAHMTNIREQQAIVGTRHAQILRAEETHMERTVSLEGQRAGVEDIDIAEVILDLQLQEVSYQTALAVTARVLQPTLMDFLR